MDPLNWFRKVPIASVLIAVAMIAVPLLLGSDLRPTSAQFEAARDEAREFYVRNPRLAVDSLGTLILDPGWLEEARAAADASDSSANVALPTRMLARSQARLDGLVERAYRARMDSDPAWRLGVLDARTPPTNYFAHAFIHESVAGIALCIAVLLFVGAALERSWGSVIFTLVVGVSIPLTAQGYRLLDATSGVPWSGSAGLAGALLGAYCIRGLGGHFLIPGWLLLPMWLAVESFVVRGFWLDDLGGVPWASICAAVGFGALVAGALRLIGVESALEAHAAKKAKSGPHPVVSRAARLRSDGDPYQAFDLIQAAWRDHPADREVAEAFFSIAVEVDQVDAAAKAILPSLKDAVRSGDTERALEYWIPIANAESDVRLEPTAAVRLGEALLDAGHPKQAIFSLRNALDSGVSSAHALRIVKVARDLDEGLTRQAANIALADPALDPASRAELEPILQELLGSVETDPPLAAASAVPESTPTPLSRRVAAEHQVVETTSFPLSDAPDAGETVVASAGADDAFGPGDAGSPPPTANETQLIDQNLDAGALSAASLAGEVDADPSATRVATEESGDVLSHWGGETRIDDVGSGLDAELDIDSDLMGDDAFDDLAEALSMSEQDLVFGESDTDLTPLMEASDETDDVTSPFEARAPADEMTMLAAAPSGVADERARDLSISVENRATIVPPRDPSETDPLAGEATTVVAGLTTEEAPPPENEYAICGEASAPPERRLRALRAVEAVPVGHHEEWVEIEVADKGKSKLPIHRIETIVVAGISGLASRPVLLVDLALNWSSDHSEPLKVIRFRSDRFDPRKFEPGEINPLDALTAWVRRLQIRSSATPLPSGAILEGHFARYENVEDYESEVLAAMREV